MPKAVTVVMAAGLAVAGCRTNELPNQQAKAAIERVVRADTMSDLDSLRAIFPGCDEVVVGDFVLPTTTVRILHVPQAGSPVARIEYTVVGRAWSGEGVAHFTPVRRLDTLALSFRSGASASSEPGVACGQYLLAHIGLSAFRRDFVPLLDSLSRRSWDSLLAVP